MLFKGPLLHKVWDLVVFLCPVGQYWFVVDLLFFFECLCKYCRHGWVFPSLVIFWMLYFFFFLFFFFFSEKSCISCFSEALLLVTRIWWVEGLSFHTKFYCKVAEVNSVRTVDDVKLFYWFACEVGCVRVCVCVCVCVSLQYNEDTHSSVHQQAWSLQCSPLLPPPTSSCLSSVFLFTPSSFDCYSQLAESTFSTCAIQRYFSTSLYSFWGSGVHFLWYALYYSDGKWVHIMDL